MCYVAHFLEHREPELSGFGSRLRLFRDPKNPSRVIRDTKRSSDVMFINIFKRKGERLAQLRYKTSAQSQHWHPDHCNGSTNEGLHIFKEGAILPGLDEVPQLEEFKSEFKNEEDVKKTILGLHAQFPEMMTKKRHLEWVQVLEFRPQTSAEICHGDLPRFTGLQPRGTLLPLGHSDLERAEPVQTRLDVIRSEHEGATDRCDLDPMDDPILDSMTSRNPGLTKADRAHASRRIRHNDADGWCGEDTELFEVGSYYIMIHHTEDSQGARLPVTLLRAITVDADMKRGNFQYYYGDSYKGGFHPWIVPPNNTKYTGVHCVDEMYCQARGKPSATQRSFSLSKRTLQLLELSETGKVNILNVNLFDIYQCCIVKF
jgi:hypothetical protein